MTFSTNDTILGALFTLGIVFYVIAGLNLAGLA